MSLKVMLAGPTKLYAPIYWGKIAGIGSFPEIEFSYPKGYDTGRDETSNLKELVSSLVSPTQETNIIICDPCRSIYCNETSFGQLWFLRSFIRKQSFKILYEPNGSYEGEFGIFPEIIVSPPKNFTGHMVAVDYLRSQVERHYPDCKQDERMLKKVISERIVKVKPGVDIELLNKHILEHNPGACIGYSTPDYFEGTGQFRDAYLEIKGSETICENGNGHVMTSIVTTAAQVKNNEKKIKNFLSSCSSVLEEIKSCGAKKAARDLKTTPTDLTQDLFRNMNEEEIESLLEQTLGFKGVSKSSIYGDPPIYVKRKLGLNKMAEANWPWDHSDNRDTGYLEGDLRALKSSFELAKSYSIFIENTDHKENIDTMLLSLDKQISDL